ncbi:hypothetical protein [Pleomorphomonas sp. PLEO]|uniref:hypothetical protein n=1 Tax=Pleomorphomonas sp. PLEO TaxID=3239306 RepID=UPI00351E3454
MEEKALTLRHELPRLIAAAKALGASMLVMLLMTVDEELHRQELEQHKEAGAGQADRP